MSPSKFRSLRRLWLLPAAPALLLLAALAGGADKPTDLASEYQTQIRPLLAQYCLNCHSTKAKKGDLDLERFTSIDQARQDLVPWQNLIDQLDSGEMPPKKNPQPKAEEKQRLLTWVRAFLDAEARARAGDPGRVVVRRLSNVEYNQTVRDLTGVDLQPARDFPGDGAAGEGFTNAGDALVMSPTLLNKYLNAAKEIAAHSVLLPDGFRFSPAKTRRDWTDEALAHLRMFHAQFSGDGKLSVAPYLAATIRHRDELKAGTITIDDVAAKEKLNPKYLQALWQVLNDAPPSFPLDRIRERWRQASAKDVEAVAAEVRTWQSQLFRFHKIGSYMNPVWQDAATPTFATTEALRVRPKPGAGQKEMVLYLVAREVSRGKEPTHVVWHRPRFEGAKQVPFLLRDVAHWSVGFEVDYATAFADTAKFLGAAAEATPERKLTVEALASKHGVDAAALKRWIDFLDSEPPPNQAPEAVADKTSFALELLPRKLPEGAKPAIRGWGDTTPDTLPVVIANSSDGEEKVPGTVPPHKVTVHPSPSQLAAVAWSSPIDGTVRVKARMAHAHPPGGNGVAWWLEKRRGMRSTPLDNGTIDAGKQAEAALADLIVGKGDLVVLAIGARDGNHTCDLTLVELTITETGDKGRVWDLGGDVADNILEANPHADKFGNKEVWRFLKGPDPTVKGNPAAKKAPRIPRGSILAQWREAAVNPKRREQLGPLATQVQTLLTGSRPTDERKADQTLFDALVTPETPLFQGADVTRWVKARHGDEKAPEGTRFGIDKARFGRHPLGRPADDGSLIVAAPAVVEVRVPADVFLDRDFVVAAQVDPASTDGIVQFEVRTTPPNLNAPLENKPLCVAAGARTDVKQMQEGFDAFRRVFPLYLFYPRIVPDDEIICLRLYCREDEPFQRLFLNAEQKQQLDRLWNELHFVSQQPLTELRNYPAFMGFVSQDGKDSFKRVEEVTREPVQRRAAEFEKVREAAEPRHLEALADFAARAYRRPLQPKEKDELTQLYQTLRKKELPHEEAFRTVLTRVLISPSFLYRIEQPGPGTVAQPVSAWEMATRLSYFLWATLPDAELRQSATTGHLTEVKAVTAQVERMLKDPKARGLATEFAAQWLHVRDLRENREKNEKLFPTFDDKLRHALFEETVLFFQDLFQNDRSVLDILDADHTFLNEALAKHYGIPGVTGPEWRRVGGMKQYGRGGVLGLGSVLTKQSGASRTSPVLRGNWVVETLLGEKIPKPPKDVPRLPEEEAGGEELTVRQMVQKHVSVAQCAVCHQRIDPFGFALERYDPIGRRRDKDLGGRAIDTSVQLKDGTRFDGIDGLRQYLLTQRQDDFLRLFCKKLLGYALGRSVTLSDQALVEEMVSELKKHEYRASAAVLTIARSKQFRYYRGLEVSKE